MLPSGLQNKIELSCYAIVSNMFATFHNPKYRGPNFTWEKFPEIMKTHCENGVFLNTEISDKHAKAAKEYASKIGKEIASRLVEVMEE